MPLLTVVLILLAVGILVGLINKYGPPYVAPNIIQLINVVVIIACIIWLCKIFGVWQYLSGVKV